MAKHEAKSKEIGSVFDLLSTSYGIVKKNWVAFAVVNIISIISALLAFSPNYNKQDKTFDIKTAFSSFNGVETSNFLAFGSIVVLAILLVSIYLFAMSTILEVESTAKKQPSVGHLFEKAKKYWLKLFAVMIVTGIIIIAGFFLLIIPGVIALGRLIMAPYFLVDKNMGIIESIKASNEMGKKHFWEVLAAVGVMLLVAIATGILGIIPVIGSVLGTLIAIAFSLVVPLRYQQLKKLS